jgi:hypothetical protein
MLPRQFPEKQCLPAVGVTGPFVEHQHPSEFVQIPDFLQLLVGQKSCSAMQRGSPGYREPNCFPGWQRIRVREVSTASSGVSAISSSLTSTTATGVVGNPNRFASLVPSNSLTNTRRCCGLFWNFTT